MKYVAAFSAQQNGKQTYYDINITSRILLTRRDSQKCHQTRKLSRNKLLTIHKPLSKAHSTHLENVSLGPPSTEASTYPVERRP